MSRFPIRMSVPVLLLGAALLLLSVAFQPTGTALSVTDNGTASEVTSTLTSTRTSPLPATAGESSSASSSDDAPVPSSVTDIAAPMTSTAAPSTTRTQEGDGEFPSPATTGFRVPESSLQESSTITSSFDGQVIEAMDVTGSIQIDHDNVTVRDSRLHYTGTYGLHVRKRSDGSCPVGTLFEYVEVDGSRAADDRTPVYGEGCEWTLDHAYVHDTGRSVKVVHDNVVSNSYIHTSRTGSDSHRGAVGNNGGSNNAVINNVLICEGRGCSAAIPMYGDFAPVDGMLVQGNLIATTGSYCAYGGSIDSKKFPNGSGVKFIDNRFSTQFFPTCGRYGVISGFDDGIRGNEFRGNVWHESGEPIELD